LEEKGKSLSKFSENIWSRSTTRRGKRGRSGEEQVDSEGSGGTKQEMQNRAGRQCKGRGEKTTYLVELGKKEGERCKARGMRTSSVSEKIKVRGSFVKRDVFSDARQNRLAGKSTDREVYGKRQEERIRYDNRTGKEGEKS